LIDNRISIASCGYAGYVASAIAVFSVV